jgi:drug/metabolite transporter (DMT)-like permease
MKGLVRAVLLAVFASFLFTLETIVVKAITGVPLATIVLARALGQLAWAIPSVIADPGVIRSSRPWLAALRGAFSGVSWWMYFVSFAALPLAMATVLSFTTVLFVTALAGPMLGERVHWRRWTATLVGFAGVVIMLQPWDSGAMPTGWPVAAAIASAFLGAVIMLTTKMLARSERTSTIMLYIGVVTTVMTLPVALPGLAWPGWWNMLLLLGTALFGPLAMHVWITAIRQADASLLAPISYVRLIFAAGFGMALFGEVPDWWLAAGAATIIGSTLYITRREAKLAKERRP